MRKLILFSLLGFIGCAKNVSRDHQIICFSPTNHNIMTVNTMTQGNVVATVVLGHSVLAYKDESGVVRVILLTKNDCEVY
jgi:hypothetical protein